jgi:polysaccharide export outer membrane protein
MLSIIRLGAAILLLSLFCGRSADAAGRRLTASDVLQVNVVNQAELNTTVRIEPDGTISLPYVGRIVAAGLTEDQLKARITSALEKADVVKNPEVLIEVTNFGAQVSVLGAVGSPGAFTLDRPTTLTQVLSRAGGIREEAGAGTVILHRRGPRGINISRYDVKAILNGNANIRDVLLENDDEVYVEQGAVYYLYGYVNKPGEFPLSRSYSVQQAIAAGGGVAPLGSDWRIEIRRRLPDGTVTDSPASLDDQIRPDDTIVVNERIF